MLRYDAVLPSMTTHAPTERGSLAELSALVPVFFAPVTWWLAFRALRASRAAHPEAATAGTMLARRLFALAAVDTIIAAVVVFAKCRAPVGSAAGPACELEPTSPFEPVLGFECGDMWRDQVLTMLWPVAVGCALIAALWIRAKHREPARTARWGLVLAPLVVAPLVGIASSHLACRVLGGWSVGVGLLGVVAQGAVMLGLGGLAMHLARAELRIVVGSHRPSLSMTSLSAVFLLSGLARVALFLFSLWSLAPELHGARDVGIEAIVAGEHGLSGRALVFFAAVVVAPAAEEVLFRGVLLPGLAQSMSAGRALFVSALVFGLFHVPSHGPAAVLPAILGVAFGWARLRSGGLRAPIALHVANNLLVTLLTWASGAGA